MVQTASLELSELPLSEKIKQFATKLERVGIKTLKIVPLFLLPGVHVREDIPREIATAQAEIGHTIEIDLCPYLGSYEGLIKIISHQFLMYPQDARIIVSHGSRRQGGNDSVEAIATQLKAKVAYWTAGSCFCETGSATDYYCALFSLYWGHHQYDRSTSSTTTRKFTPSST